MASANPFDSIKQELVREQVPAENTPEAYDYSGNIISNPKKYKAINYLPDFTIPIQNNWDFDASAILFHINNWISYENISEGQTPIIIHINFSESLSNSSEIKIIDLINYIIVKTKISNENNQIKFPKFLFIVRGLFHPVFAELPKTGHMVSYSENLFREGEMIHRISELKDEHKESVPVILNKLSNNFQNVKIS